MKKIFVFFSMIFLIFLSACNNNVISDAVPNDAIVCVNDEYILKSEITLVLEQFSGTNVTYKKIVEDSILELVVIQQAPKFDIELTESDIDDIIAEYKELHPEYYEEALNLYGEDALRKKLKDGATYDLVREYVVNNELTIDSKLIQSFREQDGFDGYLDDVSDAIIKETMPKDLENFAFKQWSLEKKDDANIIYYEDIETE